MLQKDESTINQLQPIANIDSLQTIHNKPCQKSPPFTTWLYLLQGTGVDWTPLGPLMSIAHLSGATMDTECFLKYFSAGPNQNHMEQLFYMGYSEGVLT